MIKGMMSNSSERESGKEHIFSRTESLIGKGGLDQLRQSSVAIFGLGGVGSYAAEALVRAGVGSFTLIDFDTIALTNINRQLHALHSTLGRSKVEVMKERMQDINPQAQVEILREFYGSEDADSFFASRQGLSYVVDAIDTVKSKVSLIQACCERGIPIISCMGAGNRLEAQSFKLADISKTTGCPLAKAVRKRLKQEGITQGFKVVFSPEPACKPVTYDDKRRSIDSDEDRDIQGGVLPRVPGSISFVPSVAGLLMAGEVIRELLARKG